MVCAQRIFLLYVFHSIWIIMHKTVIHSVTLILIWCKWREHQYIAQLLRLTKYCGGNKLIHIATTEHVSLAQTAWDGLTVWALYPTPASRVRRCSLQMITADRPPGNASWSIAASRVSWLCTTNFILWMKYLFAQDDPVGPQSATPAFFFAHPRTLMKEKWCGTYASRRCIGSCGQASFALFFP